MRRTMVVLTLLLLLAPVLRADDDGNGDMRTLLREVAELRKIAETEAQTRADEIKALRTALDEARQELAKSLQNASEQKAKLDAADAELRLYKTNVSTLEKLVAELEKREPPAAKVIKEVAAFKPVVTVRGKIAGVADSGLYVIAIGTDEGVEQGMVFDVIHAGDATKPLGAMTLVRAYGKQSIGQFKALGKDHPQIGDEIVGMRAEPK